MSQQLVGVGSVANDGTGDKLRDAYIKLNSNFTELYGLLDRNLKSVTQSSHGFAVKDVLRVTTSGAYAKISDPDTQEPVGLVTAVADGNNFTMVEDGFVSTLSALTANTIYYVQSSGALGTTPTSLKYFHATSATSGHILKSSRNGNLTLAQVLSNGADANGLAITNLADPTDDQDAATKVWTLAQISTPSLSSVLAVGADANATAITNLADPTDNQDAATKAYVLAQISSSLDLENVLTNDNDAGGLAIANLADPTDDQDAATKAYVLAQISTPSLSTVLAVGASANNVSITDVPDPINDQDAVNRRWVINNFGVPSLSQVLAIGADAGSVRIVNLDDPVDGQDAATKAYVLSVVGAGSSVGANHEIQKGDGAGGFAGTDIYSSTNGSLILGDSSLAGTRTIKFTNNANTITLSATPTAARSITLQDADGTLAFLSDIAAGGWAVTGTTTLTGDTVIDADSHSLTFEGFTALVLGDTSQTSAWQFNANGNFVSYGASTVATTSPEFRLQRQGGASLGVNTATADTHILGSLSYSGMDSTAAALTTGAIRAIVNGSVSAGVIPTDLLFLTSATNTAGLTERLRITSNGDFKTPDGTLGKIYQAKTTVAGGATLRGIGTSPVTIIAAPGANKYLSIVSISVSYNFSTTVYNFGAGSNPTFNFSGGGIAGFISSGQMNSGSDFNIRLNDATGVTTVGGIVIPNNTALSLGTQDNGDATTGDGDIDVVVYYTIENENT